MEGVEIPVKMKRVVGVDEQHAKEGMEVAGVINLLPPLVVATLRMWRRECRIGISNCVRVIGGGDLRCRFPKRCSVSSSSFMHATVCLFCAPSHANGLFGRSSETSLVDF